VHVLIIDDELALRQIISATVRRAGYSVDMASGVKDAAAKLVRGDFDVAICDIRMQDGDGVELVRSMKSSGVPTLFIMVTAFASVQTAVEALRAGAMDYMVKPVDSEELLYRLRQAQTLLGLKAENVALRKFVSAERDNTRFKFFSAPMLAVERLATRVAAIDNTVLITGESGTGKGVLARMIHDQSAARGSTVHPGQLQRDSRESAGKRAFRTYKRALLPARRKRARGYLPKRIVEHCSSTRSENSRCTCRPRCCM
jgi:two-component system response regulator AtoC